MKFRLLNRRSVDAVDALSYNIVPRKSTNTIRWCEPGTRTYIIFTIINAIPGIPMLDLLDRSVTLARERAHSISGEIPAGRFDFVGQNALILRIWGVGGHQLTYEVTAAALSALRDYMLGHEFGAASFWIYDGNREVGAGLVG